MQLEVVESESEWQVAMVFKIATVATNASDLEIAKRHLLAAMTVMGEWAATGEADDLCAAYDALVSSTGGDPPAL